MNRENHIYVVITYGVASALCQGITDKWEEALEIAQEIRSRNGAPKIYSCVLMRDYLDDSRAEAHT